MYPRTFVKTELGALEYPHDEAEVLVIDETGCWCSRYSKDGRFLSFGISEQKVLGLVEAGMWEEVLPEVEYFLRRLRAELYLENRAIQSKISVGLRAGRERPQILQEGHIPQPR